MRIDQLPQLPAGAGSVQVPVSFNGADYQASMEANTAIHAYQSGDAINTSLCGFGYVTTDAKQLTFIAQTPKMFNPGASVSVTSVLASVRAVGGGYLGAAINTDVTSLVASATCIGSTIVFVISQLSAWTYGSGGTSSGTVVNNTPVAGYLTVQLAVE